MITPEEFKASWEAEGDELKLFPLAAFEGVDVPQEAQAFISAAGLPDSAAPFLSFAPPKSGRLQTLGELWGANGAASGYYIIGSNGSGDPVALKPSGSVVYLNHDSGFAEVYINKNIATLAESLLRYREVIAEAQGAYGSDAYLDGQVPAHARERFAQFLEGKDPRALTAGSMWAQEVADWAG